MWKTIKLYKICGWYYGNYTYQIYKCMYNICHWKYFAMTNFDNPALFLINLYLVFSFNIFILSCYYCNSSKFLGYLPKDY